MINEISDEAKFMKQLDSALEVPKTTGGSRQKLVLERIIKEKQYFLKCHKCFEFKIDSDFLSKIFYGCKKCRSIRKNNDCIRGRLKNLIRQAKSSTSENNKSLSDHRKSLTCSITFEDLIDQLRLQKGRCFYSNVIMNYVTKSDWLISLERKNPFEGYKRENICLVCYEFNTSDHRTTKGGTINDGGGFWSVEKFAEFKAQIM